MPEHAPLGDFDIAANGKDVRRDPTKHNVGIRAGGTQRNRRHQDRLGCQQRALGPTSDARSVLDDFHRIDRDSAGHFGCGPARVMSALSAEPDETSVALNPRASDSMATKTPTVPAIPTTATIVDVQRAFTLRTL